MEIQDYNFGGNVHETGQRQVNPLGGSHSDFEPGWWDDLWHRAWEEGTPHEKLVLQAKEGNVELDFRCVAFHVPMGENNVGHSDLRSRERAELESFPWNAGGHWRSLKRQSEALSVTDFS